MTAVTLPDQILEGPVPKHRQLRDVLARLAVPGEAIPSERDLTATYGVSRATVRKAIDTLVYEGLLQRTHGLGTFAVRPRLGTQLHLASFTQDMHRRGMVPSTRLVSIRREVPPDPIARALGLGPLDRAWSLRRLRLADGQAIALEDAWYPVSLLPGLDQHDLESSLYALFQNQYGLTIDGAEQTLWGEAATGDVARLIACPEHTPLLVFRRVASAGDRPVEYVLSWYRGDRYEVNMSLGSESAASRAMVPS